MEKTLEERMALRKSRQSEAHRRWRMSDKGKAYYAKRKQQKAGVIPKEDVGS